jgi:hypothetical protein
MLSIALLHGVLVRFGVGRGGAALGTATVAFSPLFLPLATLYLTDIPGLLVILLCVAMCQMAALSATVRSACAWLIAAGLVNVALGSVRQICWLGVLVMVPSTAWLVARRLGRAVLWTGLVVAALSVPMILWCVHWFLAHPYTFSEKIIAGPVTPKMVAHFGMQYVLAALLTIALLFPVAVRFVQSGFRGLSRAARMRTAGAALVTSAVLAAVAGRPVTMSKMVFPWLEPFVNDCGFPRIVKGLTNVATFGLGVRAVITVAVVGLGWYLLERAWAGLRRVDRPVPRLMADDQALSFAAILGPYSLAYILALAGRAMYFEIQDRYLLLLLPSFLVLLLLMLERVKRGTGVEKRGSRWPQALSIGTLAFLIAISIACTHSDHAYGSAVTRLDQRMQAEGIPRPAISEGFAADLQAQVAHGGHTNVEGLLHPANAYDPAVPHWDLPKACQVGMDTIEPRLHPVYFFSLTPGPPECFVPSAIAPEPYLAWLPPFHREIWVLTQKPGTHREPDADVR